MGKNLTQQKRGKGSTRYRAPSFNYKGEAKFGKRVDEKTKGDIMDVIHCPGHSGPLAQIKYDNGDNILIQAPEGIRVGGNVFMGENVENKTGNIMPLKNIPEGSSIYNIESSPGDGGKFARTAGAFAKIVAKMKDKIVVQLPSKKERSFLPECRAIVGVVAGAGKVEKPFLKAGNRYYAMKARNKLWPQTSATSMNAVAHPFGGRSSCRHKCPLQSSRNAPPGRKVGSIAPRRTGRK